MALGPLGGIAVDEEMRTSVPDIFAAGDAVETPQMQTKEPVLSMLAGPANREGRIAGEAICGRHSAYRGTQGTAIVKVFDMTAGGTGLTETQLRERNIDFRKIYTHQNGHAAYYPGTSPLFLKVLFAPTDGALLGAQVLGWDGVDKRIDVLAVALRAGMTVYDLEHLELAYAPPYGAAKDPVNMAGFQASNLLRGDIELWYAEDYPECAGRTTILDVRTPAEYEYWHIAEAINIPYTELRSRLAEVPKDHADLHLLPVRVPELHRLLHLEAAGFRRRCVPLGRHDHLPRLPSDPARRRRRVGCRSSPTPRTRWRNVQEPSSRSDARRSPRAFRPAASWVTSTSTWRCTCGRSMPKVLSGTLSAHASGGWTSPVNG